MVVGDSTAWATGDGMVAWAADHADIAHVAVQAAPGCGFIRDGVIPTDADDGFRNDCRELQDERIPDALSSLHPDVVVGMVTFRDLADRVWDDTEGPIGPSDERFLARLVGDYDTATQQFLAAGASDVLWVLAPIPDVRPFNEAWAQALEPARSRALRRGAARGRRPAPRPGDRGRPRRLVRRPAGRAGAPRRPALVTRGGGSDRRGLPRPGRDGGGPVMSEHELSVDDRSCRPAWSSAGSTRRTSGTRSSSSAPPQRCDRLAVYVNSSRARDRAPGELRAAWLAGLHPEVTVIEVVHDLPTDFGDEHLWQRWIDLFRDALAVRARTARRLLQRPLRRGTGPAPGRRASRRRCRSDQRPDQRHHDPRRSRRPSGDARTAGAGVGRGELGVRVTAAGGRCGCTAAAPSTPRGRSAWPRRRTPRRR